jgi:hypothetical protein
MKKFFKIFLISMGVILALLVIIPYAFKGRIMQLAKDEINKNLNARVEFADLRLSLIRNFPNLSVALTGMSVVGVDEFANDTLVSFAAFRTVVDIKSVISGDEIIVRSILLDRPRVKAIVHQNGNVNWDIMKETDEVADPDAEETEFQVGLRRFEIKNGWIEYADAPMEVRTTLGRFNMKMRGDLSQDLTSLDISASSGMFNMWYEGVRYIANASLNVTTLLDADLNDFRFTVREGEIKLNEIDVELEGFVAMPGDDIDMDLKFFSRKTDFKSILSMIPAIYMSDFDGLEARGSLALEGFVRGTMTEETMPSVGLDLIVQDAGFNYPDLPESLENMHMNLNIYYDGVDDDKTTVDLHSFHIEMAGNPFDMSMSIRTPMSDMAVNASMQGTIDFTSIADIVPLDGITLRGLLESDVVIAGNMSDIENERYEDFNAGGSMRLTAFQYVDTDFPQGISIPRAVLEFSPRFVELSEFEMLMGNSDFRMTGRLENFIPYVFDDGVVRGNLLFSSSLLDLNEFLAEEETAAADTVPLTVVEIPGNVNFVLASSIDRILYDNMEISDLKGRIIIRDNRMIMEGVNMNMLEGTLRMTGEYNTQDMSAPFINFNMEINDFDIPASFNTFNTVQQLTPVAKDMRGKVSSTMQMYSLLDDEMMPVMTSIDAKGRLRTSSVELIASETFERLAGALRLSEDRTNVFRDLDISFAVKEGRVYVDPFETRMGPVNMIVGGDQGLDQTLNYLVKLTIPRSEFGSGANQVIENLVSGAAARGLNVQPGDNVNVDARIAGTFADPQISLNMMESARSSVNQVREQIRTQAVEEIEKRVEQVEDRVREEASERADNILREAEQRAAQIKKAAEDAANQIRKEGEANALRIESEASGRGRIAEAAAKRAADGVRRESAQKADALVKEADERADKLMQDARNEADKLR